MTPKLIQLNLGKMGISSKIEDIRKIKKQVLDSIFPQDKDIILSKKYTQLKNCNNKNIEDFLHKLTVKIPSTKKKKYLSNIIIK